MPDDDRYEHYEIVKRADGSLWELGPGDMSVTYKAYDTHLHRPVVLKVMNAVCIENETARHRFLDEARAAGALRHQNVASVFHLGMDHDNYFYAMEFVDGQAIDKYLKQKGTLTTLEALDIAIQVTRALAAAAKQGLIQRDLKPANLILVDEEGEKVVKVTDFGLAKRVERESEESRSLPIEGGFLGTPDFASPEQLKERGIDVRSNIYSLGATLYYLVTGHPPFSGSVGQIMSQHLRPVPTEPLQGYPPSFVNLVLSMMEKNPDKRPQNATELRETIRNCIRELSGTEINTSHLGVITALSQHETTPTVALVPSFKGTVAVGSVFAGKYRVDQTLPDNVAGKCYRGVDLERQLNVRLLVLSDEYLADVERSTTLKKAVNQVRKAPHRGLRQIIALETAGNQIVLVEEFFSGPSLLEILRARGLFSPTEVVATLKPLAPVVDHALRKQLEYVDFTLGGIQLLDSAQGKDRADIEEQVKKPLTKWSELTPLVAPIDFALGCDGLPTLASGATVAVQSFGSFCRQKDSYVRQLSLLAYELLGGPRSTLENRGRYTSLAALSEEGNHVLRRGLIDEVATASDLVNALDACLTDRFASHFVYPVPALSANAP